MGQLIITETIHDKIFLIRGHKVMLSIHLAELYEVETRILVQAVKRNAERFPPDFVFQITPEEMESLRSQIVILNDPDIKISRSQFVTLKRGRHIKYLPYAFTEQGVAMLSSVLRSKRAVLVNIAIMRAFVKLREILSTHKELAAKFRELEERVGQHDSDIQAIFEAIRQLMEPPVKPKVPIGFHP